MKVSISASLAFAALSWASPVDPVDSVHDVVSALKARTDGATFFHAGADHVLRAIDDNFQVVGTAGLTKKQADDFHGSMGETVVKRDAVDERNIVSAVEQSVRRDHQDNPLLSASRALWLALFGEVALPAATDPASVPVDSSRSAAAAKFSVGRKS